MARQNIQFKGLRHSPSDITGQDGDLLECVNLIHENGELKPIEMPEKMMMRGYGKDENVYILVAVHNLTDGKKFVFARFDGTNTNIIVKRDGHTAVFYEHAIMGEEIQWAETIGNTLIIGTDKSTHYALYKNGAYKWLGDKLPQPVFEFDMGKNDDDGCYNIEVKEPYTRTFALNENGEPVYSSEPGGISLAYAYEEFYDETAQANRYRFYATPRRKRDNSPYIGIPVSQLTDVLEENKKTMRDNFVAKMAKLVHTQKQENRFIYPFLIRYAVRMYDGNYEMHSAPLLMLPSTFDCPILSLVDYFRDPSESSDKDGNIVLQCKSKPLKLKFLGFNDELGNDLYDIEDWSDIIKSVDIFLSSEIVTYNERYFDNLDNFPLLWYMGVFPNQYGDGGGRSYVEEDRVPDYGNAYAENTKEDWMTNHVDNGFDIDERTVSQPSLWVYYLKHSFLPIKNFDKKEIERKISVVNTFYRFKSYTLEELKNVSEDWADERYIHDEVEYGLLERLETLPILPDDYVSRSRMTGNVNYNYNQRLMLGNIKLQAPLWYQDTKTFDFDNYDLKIFFEIEKQEKTIVIEYDKPLIGGVGVGEMYFGHYLFYPDPDCKRAIVKQRVQTPGSMVYAYRYIEVPMQEHTGLHGAYALMPDLQSLHESFDDFQQTTEPTPSSDIERYYQMPNTIAMSSVANPFHFPASNFKDIGRTKVVGIAANTLDVSSGQWGQYPLYVFCSDGIIAVMIDGEGKFGGIQAVSADVLREPRGLSQPTLIQLGQALMFLTQRGVMTIAGTQINCLSEAMNGRHFNPMRELADVDYHIGAFANLIGRTSDDTDFRDFAASGFLAFDYAHNRVLMLRSDRDYQYVYSLNTGFWSKQIIYTNLESFQIEVVPGNELPAQRNSGVPLLKVKPIRAAVNNYTEMYLQDEDGWLYKTMEVQGQNSVKQLYQYGYIVSRPIRFGTDEYKTLERVLHRYNHFANMSFVKMALYGSRDGVRYGRINTLRGMSYQYFIFVIYTYLKPNERYSYMSVEFTPRLTNKLR